MSNTIESSNEMYTKYEADIISLISQGKTNPEELRELANLSDIDFEYTIQILESKNLICFDKNKNQYKFDKPVIGDKVIFDGNLLLPVNIITLKDKKYITRGQWYELPLDFDIRRIIWNVQLPNYNNTTLLDLIQNSIAKEKKTRIKQVEEYKNLVNKIVPYNNNLKIRLNVIGEELCDVTIMFILQLGTGDIKIDFKEFTVKSFIKTEDLIHQLTVPDNQRNFEEIQLNRLYNVPDFIFLNNCIPISFNSKVIEYVKITKINKSIELTHFSLDYNGNLTKLDVEEFTVISEGVDYIAELMEGLPSEILFKNNFTFD